MSADAAHHDRALSAYWAQWKFARLAVPLRTRARELGYALLVHGSLARDIDMVAVPWTDAAVPLRALLAEFAKTIREHNAGVAFSYDAASERTDNSEKWLVTVKPHGRLSVSIHIGGGEPEAARLGGTYIDLSVMPVLEPAAPAPRTCERCAGAAGADGFCSETCRRQVRGA